MKKEEKKKEIMIPLIPTLIIGTIAIVFAIVLIAIAFIPQEENEAPIQFERPITYQEGALLLAITLFGFGAVIHGYKIVYVETKNCNCKNKEEDFD